MTEPIVSGVTPEEADDELRAKLERATGLVGDLGEGEDAFNPYGAYARRPEVFEALMNYNEAALRGENSLIDPHIKELMRLKSAEINRCTYCGTLRVQDVRDEVEPLEQQVLGEFSGEELTRREALAVKFAEKMGSDPHQISDEFYTELKEEFTEDEIVELVFTECVYKMGHCIANTLKLGTGEENLEYPMSSSQTSSPAISDD
jgi:alkylhydroperoxidase family enzyme